MTIIHRKRRVLSALAVALALLGVGVTGSSAVQADAGHGGSAQCHASNSSQAVINIYPGNVPIGVKASEWLFWALPGGTWHYANLSAAAISQGNGSWSSNGPIQFFNLPYHGVWYVVEEQFSNQYGVGAPSWYQAYDNGFGYVPRVTGACWVP